MKNLHAEILARYDEAVAQFEQRAAQFKEIAKKSPSSTCAPDKRLGADRSAGCTDPFVEEAMKTRKVLKIDRTKLILFVVFELLFAIGVCVIIYWKFFR